MFTNIEKELKALCDSEPTVTLTASEYAELVAKAERLRLIEKALDTTIHTFQIKSLFFGEEGEL